MLQRCVALKIVVANRLMSSCTYRLIWSLKSFHHKSEVSWSDLVICHSLTQASVVILIQTTIKNNLKFTCKDEITFVLLLSW